MTPDPRGPSPSGGPPNSPIQQQEDAISCPDSIIRFERIGDETSRIYLGSDYVGDVYADDDILRPGKRIFFIHLDFDWRGPCRVLDRSLVRKTAQRMVDTLPWR